MVPSLFVLEFLKRSLRLNEDIGSGSEVNRLVGELASQRRGFHLLPSERCGDHDVAAYLAQIMAIKQKFLRLAACAW